MFWRFKKNLKWKVEKMGCLKFKIIGWVWVVVIGTVLSFPNHLEARRVKEVPPKFRKVDPNSLFPLEMINKILKEKGLEPTEAVVIRWDDHGCPIIS